MDLGFEVVDLPEATNPGPGDTAPDFTRPLVNTEFWEDVSLSELASEEPVLLVFYTMDGDFPATYIWNEIRDRGWRERFDVNVVGLSISTPYEHSRFLEEREMEYDLFTDPSNGVAEKYGIVNPLDGMAGIEEPMPAAFLIDGDMEIRYVWVSEKWPEFPPYEEIEEAMGSV
ncbi:MAG: redoxin domain-containing protein [Halobacteria archaeon]